jgi:hypothetical protein
MPVGKHGYLASPPPTRRVVARLATQLGISRPGSTAPGRRQRRQGGSWPQQSARGKRNGERGRSRPGRIAKDCWKILVDTKVSEV